MGCATMKSLTWTRQKPPWISPSVPSLEPCTTRPSFLLWKGFLSGQARQSCGNCGRSQHRKERPFSGDLATKRRETCWIYSCSVAHSVIGEISDLVNKQGKNHVYSLSTHYPTTETVVLYAYFVDQNTEGKGKSRLTGIQSQLITHTPTPDKRQGKQCNLFSPCCQNPW